MSEASNSADAPRLGAIVDTPDGPGVVRDRDMNYREALVRLREGSVLSMTHGAWYRFTELTVTGYDPDASVWYGTREVPASEVPSHRVK